MKINKYTRKYRDALPGAVLADGHEQLAQVLGQLPAREAAGRRLLPGRRRGHLSKAKSVKGKPCRRKILSKADTCTCSALLFELEIAFAS